MKFVCVVLALLLPPVVLADGKPVGPAASDSPFHYSVGFGLGHSYGTLGAHAEVRLSHWAAFAAAGFEGAAGVKWYSGQGSGFVLSLHASYYPMLLGLQDDEKRTATVALTAGWRIRNSDRSYIEFAVGPAYSFQRYEVIPEGPNARPVYYRNHGWGAFFMDADTKPVLPDLAIAMGFEF
jgi:hypothetical protein